MEIQYFSAATKNGWGIFGLVIALVTCGCGPGGPELSEVVGRITLDGEPVEGAAVQFIPQSEAGTTSFGKTTSDGRYRMEFSASSKGVMLGKSVVQVFSDDTVKVGGKSFNREIFPAKYNRNSELVTEVTSGTNEFNVDCQSDETTRRAMKKK